MEEADTQKYPSLKTVDIDALNTSGHDIGDLVSLQLVHKVLELIEDGDYSFVVDEKTMTITA